LVEIEELAVQAELGEVADGPLDPSEVSDAARLQRVEASGTDQPLDRRRGGVVVGSVEEHGPPRSRFALPASASAPSVPNAFT